jgi:hypothetical protein
MYKKHSILSLLLLLFIYVTVIQGGQLKPRLVVLTDIGPNDIEPDDRESMTRLLVSADLFEIEALIANTGWNTSNYPPGWMDSIKVATNAYEKDLPNLMKRSGQTAFLTDESKQGFGYWPSAAYVRSRTMTGSSKMGFAVLGNNNNSAGSDFIIKLADENDDRPIHVAVWGGGNTVAQAIWRIQKERTPEQLKTFLHKLRVYTITDQDKPWGSTVAFSISSHQWMRREFVNDLLFIWDECAWLHQNSTGANCWSDYVSNVQGHGNLGAQYPRYRWGVEGDTPSFIYLMAPGLSDPGIPTQCSWGGYFEKMKTPDSVTYAYTNFSGTRAYDTSYKYVNYFYPANFNNFAARMDWAQSGTGNRNPVVIVNNDSSYSIIKVEPLVSTELTLNGADSYDPDGNTLTFKWWVMAAAGTYPQSISIANASSNSCSIDIPANSAEKTIHIICEVKDNGTPNLTSYRRIIIEPTDKSVSVNTPVQKQCTFHLNNKHTLFYDLKGQLLTHNGTSIKTCGAVISLDNNKHVNIILK